MTDWYFGTNKEEPMTEGDVAIATVEPTGGSITTGDAETLPVPTNLRWGNNFDPQWDIVEEAHGHYLIEIYKDGAPFYASGWSLGTYAQKEFEEVNFSPYVNESGTYTFRVATSNAWDPENTVASAYSDWSEPKVYVRPDAQLGTTVGYWDSEKEGTFCYFGVENAGGYRLNFYEVDEEGNYRSAGGQWYVGDTNYDTATNLHTEDLTHRITDAGKYAVSVQALSADISAIANGVEGAKSSVFNTGVTSDKVEETLNELPYAAANNITVDNDVDEAVEALGVKADQIDMVGAALNTGSGDVTLEMNVTKEEAPAAPSVPEVPSAPSVDTKNEYVSAPIESEHTLADGKEVRMITVDGNSSVYVIGDKNYIPTGSVFNSDAVTEGAVYTKAANAVNKKFGAGTSFSVYEMTLKNASGQAIQPGGYINVTLPIPAGMADESGKTIWAYRLEANGKLTKLDTAVSNNQVTFATNHFSTYILVEVNGMISPKTGDTVGMMPAVMLLLALASAALIVSKKKIA